MDKVENLLGSLSQMDRESFLDVSSKLCADIILLKGAGKGINALSKIPGKIKGSGFLETVESNLAKTLTEHPSLTTPEGFVVKAPQVFEETNILKNTTEKLKSGSTKVTELINQTPEAILKNGYYEVNGFKFSEYYYNKLWKEGRGAPSLIVREVLDHAKISAPDIRLSGFFRYEHGE